MTPDILKEENKVLRIMQDCELDIDYHITKTIMETGLYSLYLLSSNNRINARDKVVVIEHPPAQRPTAHFLAVKVKETSTMNDFLIEVRKALDTHFKQLN